MRDSNHRLMVRFLLIIMCIFNLDTIAQEASTTDYESRIKISATIGTKEIPLNRDLKFTVVVEWTGDIKRYQISEVENPVVENFEIVSSSAADRRLSEAGVEKAARIYEFTLKPKALGMGYIESVILKYIDNDAGEGHSLITNRLSVKVIDPVAEPGSKRGLINLMVLAGMIIIVLLISLWLWQRKIQARKQTETTQVRPIEVEYLTLLRETLKLNTPDLKINEAFWSLSRIIRKYLSQKYHISALESTTEQIIVDLAAVELDQAMLNNLQEILTESDVAKFAGSEVSRTELDRMYTLTEAILERNVAAAKIIEQSKD